MKQQKSKDVPKRDIFTAKILSWTTLQFYLLAVSSRKFYTITKNVIPVALET